MLRDALIGLMKTTPWDRINVQAICDRADVSRSTFYAHFDNKHELREFSFGQLEAELDAEHPDRGLGRDGRFAFLPALLDHVAGHRTVLKINARSAAGFAILVRFRRVIETLARREIEQAGRSPAPSADRVAFLCGGIAALIEAWIEGGCRDPAQAVLNRIDAIVAELLD